MTFINPYNEKGFELAVRIAERCPEIPFLFVESWKLDGDHRAKVEQTIAPLKNVTLQNRTDDMKTVYGRTKILLAPSKWEEAWGRVASEAHCSGIPVVGSRRGGLPEAIGEGGIVLDYDAPLDDWVASHQAAMERRRSLRTPVGGRPRPIRGGRSSIQSISSRRSSTSCNAPPPGPGLPSTPSLANAPQSRHIARRRSIGMQHEDRLCRW